MVPFLDKLFPCQGTFASLQWAGSSCAKLLMVAGREDDVCIPCVHTHVRICVWGKEGPRLFIFFKGKTLDPSSSGEDLLGRSGGGLSYCSLAEEDPELTQGPPEGGRTRMSGVKSWSCHRVLGKVF
jgi:hypothetical protein